MICAKTRLPCSPSCVYFCVLVCVGDVIQGDMVQGEMSDSRLHAWSMHRDDRAR